MQTPRTRGFVVAAAILVLTVIQLALGALVAALIVRPSGSGGREGHDASG